jgi:uncharacterized integral membrane protein
MSERNHLGREDIMGDDNQDAASGTPARAQTQVTSVPTVDAAFSTKATKSRLGNWEWTTLVIIVALLILISIFHNQLGIHLDFETSAVLIAAAIVLYGANKTFVFRGGGKNDNIPYVIAFDSVCFVIIGLVAAILACSHWQTALLLAGSCLLIGGFFGLLFGYPQGVAQQVAQAAASRIGVEPSGSPSQPSAQQVSQATNHGKTLLADSAATLGKVITGFTLAKLDSANKYFEGLCRGVGPALGAADSSNSHVLAGVIIAYFLATGFLSGLFLPSYFMRDQF